MLHHGRGDVETKSSKACAVDTAATSCRMKEALLGMLEVWQCDAASRFLVTCIT